VKIKGIDMKKISSVIFLSFLILFLLVSCEKKSSLEYECDEDCEKESALEAKKFECNKVKPNYKLPLQTSCPRSLVEKCKNQEIGVRNKYGDINDSFIVSCIITTPTGKKYNYGGGCLRRDEWFYLSYPKDFNISLPLESGEYLVTWIIGKKQVAKDKFIVK
jgi:hypothetical protein